MAQDIVFCVRTGRQIVDGNVVEFPRATMQPRLATIADFPLSNDEKQAIRRKLAVVLTPREFEGVCEAWPEIDDI